jgi:hypothetical protein
VDGLGARAIDTHLILAVKRLEELDVRLRPAEGAILHHSNLAPSTAPYAAQPVTVDQSSVTNSDCPNSELSENFI